MSLSDKETEYLMYASPCVEFQERVNQLSDSDRRHVFLRAKYEAKELYDYFPVCADPSDRMAACIIARDLSERALLLYREPKDFKELEGVMGLATKVVPTISNSRAEELNIPQQRMGLGGMAAEMVKEYHKQYLEMQYRIGIKSVFKNLFFTLICAAIMSLFLFHPFFVELFAGDLGERIFKFLGWIIAAVVLFKGGFSSAVIFLVTYHVAVFFGAKWIPLTTLIKIVVCAIPALIGLHYCRNAFYLYGGYRKIQKLAKKNHQYVEPAEKGKAYFDACLARAKEYNSWQKSRGQDSFDDVVKYYEGIVKSHADILRVLSK